MGSVDKTGKDLLAPAGVWMSACVLQLIMSSRQHVLSLPELGLI